jgi:hypothetical protein
MLQPSSLPLPIRTIEWIRDNNGAWLVNGVERYYYTLTAPKKGGPPLRSLPSFGVRRAQAGPSRKRIAYVPPRIEPVIASSLGGEGVWRGIGSYVGGQPTVLVTIFRPDPDYPQQLAYAAWIDSAQAQLALYPGRVQPPDASPRGPMEVPSGQRSRLLATFNSGFTYKDCKGGFAVNGRTIEPMVDGQGTVVAYRDGHMDVMSWHGGPNVGPDVMVARQNLPLIVSAGRPTPALNATREWGATLGNKVRVWRSALGVDRLGNLIYLAAPGQTAPSLASAIIHAGAVRAIELDINAEWPSFITYGAGVRAPAKLVPNKQQGSNRYLVPDDRDFFAVYLRKPGTSAAVLQK